MIRVTRGRSPAACVAGDDRVAPGAAVKGAGEALEEPFSEASRRITRTSSSTERPLRAARSRNASLTASSSFRMVRLAMAAFVSRDLDCNDINIVIAVQSQLPNGEQDTDEGERDDPERQRPPTALATLGSSHRG